MELTALRAAYLWISKSPRSYQTWVGTIVGILALMALLSEWRPWRTGMFLTVSVFLGYLLPYLVVQQDPRISYPLYPFKLLLAVALIERILKRSRMAATVFPEAVQ
jgi:hypothetical protein